MGNCLNSKLSPDDAHKCENNIINAVYKNEKDPNDKKRPVKAKRKSRRASKEQPIAGGAAAAAAITSSSNTSEQTAVGSLQSISGSDTKPNSASAANGSTSRGSKNQSHHQLQSSHNSIVNSLSATVAAVDVSSSKYLTTLPPSGATHSSADNFSDTASSVKRVPKFRAKFDHKVTDKYDIKALIGRGNFSRVVRVEHRQSRQPYAIKMIDKQKGKDVSDAELAVLQRVRHPYIIQLLEFIDSPDKVYLVMELATGGELFDRIIAKTNFSELETMGTLEMILEGLRHLHRLGFVHRDLKPENLLYYHPGEDSKLMITDFGLSANCKTQKDGFLMTTCGTPEYIAPEILMRQPYNTKVDMWGIGVITYILLSGTMPFDDDHRPRLYKNILKAKYSYDDEIWANVSPVAKDFIDRLLKVDQKDRMSSSQALKHPWITQNALINTTYSRQNSAVRRTVSGTLLRKHSVASSSRSVRSARSNRSSHSNRSLRSENRRVMPEEIEALHRDPDVIAELSSTCGSSVVSASFH